jgi:hypothetical protein
LVERAGGELHETTHGVAVLVSGALAMIWQLFGSVLSTVTLSCSARGRYIKSMLGRTAVLERLKVDSHYRRGRGRGLLSRGGLRSRVVGSDPPCTLQPMVGSAHGMARQGPDHVPGETEAPSLERETTW